MKVKLLVLIIAALGLFSCSPKQSNVEFVEQFREIETRFVDAVQLASVTSRAGLPPVISELQSIEREAMLLVYPDDMPEWGRVSCEARFIKATACFVEFLGGEDYPRDCRSIAPQSERCFRAMIELVD